MASPRAFDVIFGDSEARYLQTVATIAETLISNPARFFRVPDERFEILLKANEHTEVSLQYWRELLGRVNFAAQASYIRAWKWLAGMQQGYDHGLFLPFCGGLRAFMEFTADSHCALAGVATSLSANKNTINAVLRRKYRYGFVAKELEDQLIHFSHARKADRGESVSPLHRARAPFEYIKELESTGLEGLYEFYSLLCQFTHPAAESVQYMVVPGDDHHFFIDGGHDEVRIEALVQDRRAMLRGLLAFAFNSPSVVLKVLLHVDESGVHVPIVRRLDLSAVPLWKECQELLKKPVQAPPGFGV